MARSQDAEGTLGRQTAPPTVADAGIVPGRTGDASGADEPLGGDPPCWAHLFGDDDDAPASR